jgi:hypothetical protein
VRGGDRLLALGFLPNLVSEQLDQEREPVGVRGGDVEGVGRYLLSGLGYGLGSGSIDPGITVLLGQRLHFISS